MTASYLMFTFESLHLSEVGNVPGRVLCHHKRCTSENKNSFRITQFYSNISIATSAAIKLKRKSIGIEIDKKHFDMMEDRLLIPAPPKNFCINITRDIISDIKTVS